MVLNEFHRERMRGAEPHTNHPRNTGRWRGRAGQRGARLARAGAGMLEGKI